LNSGSYQSGSAFHNHVSASCASLKISTTVPARTLLQHPRQHDLIDRRHNVGVQARQPASRRADETIASTSPCAGSVVNPASRSAYGCQV
jgi:hypothetical protein